MGDPVSSTFALIQVFAAAHPIAFATANFLGAVALAKALTPKIPKLSGGGNQTSWQGDPQAGLPFAIGRTGTSGNVVFQYPSGNSNEYMNFMTVLSAANNSTGIQQIETTSVNKEAVTFNGAGKATTGSFANAMWMTAALGLMPASALAMPSDLPIAADLASWTSAHKLSGYAATRLTLKYDTKIYTGTVKPLWVVKGVKVYDPRLDSTYPGGSGTHRANDPETWQYSDNPYLHAITWLIGYHANGKLIGGVGVPLSMIDLPAFVEGANVSEANEWHVGGVVSSLDSKWQVLQSILQAGAGVAVPSGAKISCRVNCPRTSLATLNESDICGAVSVPAVRTRRDRKNAIIPRYRSETHDWEIVSASPVTSSTYQTEDGGLRQKEVEYALCQDVHQASQLAGYDLVNAREFEPITLTAKPSWMGYRVGDCITVNLPEMGLNSQKCVITGRDLDLTSGAVSLSLISETDAKHAFALGITGTAPATPGLTQPDFATVMTPTSGAWSATATTLSGVSGAAIPAIRVTGSASEYPFAQSIIIEYKIHTDTTWTSLGGVQASATGLTISGLGGVQTYDVGISYQSIYGITGSRLVISSITTPAGSGGGGTGALASLNAVTFGDGTITETSGGTTATLTNFKTPLGTAASIAGQGTGATTNVGSLAVLNSLALGGSYLTGFGSIAGLSSLGYGTSYLTGFGALAAEASLYFGSSLLTETLGGAIATLTTFKTALGTASAVAGQSIWATYTAYSPSSVVGSNANLLFDGGFRLRGQGWSIDGVWGFVLGAAEGAMFQTSASGTHVGISPPRTVYGSVDYTLQVDMYAGGITAGGLFADVEYFDSSNASLGYSSRAQGVNGHTWEVQSVTFTTPSTCSYIKARFFIESATNTNAAVRRMKIANGTNVTLFTDEETNGALYASGQSLEALKPQEIGANVTETRTASSIAGQGTGATANIGALALLNSLAYGSGYLTGFGSIAALSSLSYGTGYLTGFGGLAPLSSVALNSTHITLADGTTVASETLLVTSYGTAAAIAGQGTGATTNVGTMATQDASGVAITGGTLDIGGAGGTFQVASNGALTITSSSTFGASSLTSNLIQFWDAAGQIRLKGGIF